MPGTPVSGVNNDNTIDHQLRAATSTCVNQVPRDSTYSMQRFLKDNDDRQQRSLLGFTEAQTPAEVETRMRDKMQAFDLKFGSSSGPSGSTPGK